MLGAARLAHAAGINATVPLYMDTEFAALHHNAAAYARPRSAALLRLVSHDVAQVLPPASVQARAALHSVPGVMLGATHDTHPLIGATDDNGDNPVPQGLWAQPNVTQVVAAAAAGLVLGASIGKKRAARKA